MPDQSPETIIPLVAEQLNVSTRQIATGRIRVETETELVEHLASARLETSNVDVTRVSINRVVTETPDVRTVDDVVIIPVLEEILVVEKRLVLKEELHVTRRITTEDVSVPVSLRKQKAIITRT